MQSLFEEFFKKVYGYSKGKTNSLFLIIVIRMMIYGFILLAILFIIYTIWKRNFVALGIFIGLVLLGELAHFLRKWREKAVHKKAPKAASREHAAEMLKTEKSKNKRLLGDKSKNKNLLGNKPKNKNLLGKKKG